MHTKTEEKGAGTSTTFSLQSGLREASLRIAGTGTAPDGTLVGPNNLVIPIDPTDQGFHDSLREYGLGVDTEDKADYVVVESPEKGKVDVCPRRGAMLSAPSARQPSCLSLR